MGRWSLVVAVLAVSVAVAPALSAAITIIDERGDAGRADDLSTVDVVWRPATVSFRITYYARRDPTSFAAVELNRGGGAKADFVVTNDEAGPGLYTAGPRPRLVAKARLRIASPRALVYTVPAKRLPRVVSFRVVTGDRSDRAPDAGWEPLAL